MGQRIVISEEEKKHIKKLYEAETIPPDESTFVIKTNPFNKKEYLNARQPYSGELKNGDLYVNIDYSRLSEWVKRELSKLLVGKTIRFTQDDVIMKFGEIDNVFLYDIKDSGFKFISKHYPEKTNIILSIYFVTMNDKNFVHTIKLNYSTYGSQVEDIYGEYVKGDGREYIKTNYQYKGSVNEFKKMLEILKPFNLSNLPDEYFEIRRIERKPTDF
jgi:hypothetical protein